MRKHARALRPQNGVAGHIMPVDTAMGVAAGGGATTEAGKQRVMAGPTGAAPGAAAGAEPALAGVAQTGECMGGGMAAPLGVIMKLLKATV